jgi:peptide/nickel transport system substrate-binding protein
VPRFRGFWSAIVLSSSIVCGCSGSGPTTPSGVPPTPTAEPEKVAVGPPVRGDWLVEWLLADPENLNPLTSNDAASSEVLGPILSSLLGMDPKTFEPIPVLAEARPSISPDHLVYTFKLRTDATFSDGTPVTVDDVLFSVKAIKDPEVNAPFARNYFESLVDAHAVDASTIRFRCSEPYFRNEIVFGGIGVMPRHFYDPKGELDSVSVADLANWDYIDAAKKQHALDFARSFNVDFDRKVMGAGAYVLADPDRDIITGERIVLRHRDGFWAPGDALRGDGWVDRYFYRVINNQDAALVALKAGTLDVMTLTPLQHLKQTNTPGFRARFKKEIAFAPQYVYIGWNQLRPIFRDRQLRQALSHLVDRDRIIERVLFGYGEKVDSTFYRFSQEYDTDLEGFSFDPELAGRMLDAAGWKDRNADGIRQKMIDGKMEPLRFEIISNSGNTIRKNIGLIAVDQFRRAGVDASFREVDWSILLDRIKRFDYDAIILGWQFSPNDPDLYQIWHSSQAVPGGSNHVAFKNAEADRILVEYRREFDKQKRIALYRRLQEIIHEEAPYTFLYMPKVISAVDRRFKNTIWYPTGGPNVGEWWVPTADQKYSQ